MKRAFTQIFWGLILSVLDLKVNNLDLLPDFVGYVLVGLGASSLAGSDRRFGTASVLALILGIVALAGFFIPISGRTPVWLVVLAVDLVMVWTLLGGIASFARHHQSPDLAGSALRLRLLYVAFASATALASAFATARLQGLPFAAFALVIAELVVMAFILRLVWQARRLA